MHIKQGEMLTSLTVKIHSCDADDRIASTGTGFYYSIEDSYNYVPCIITNKHVVEGAKSIIIRFTRANEGGERINEYVDFRVRDLELGIVKHPEVDLCAITLFPIVEELKTEGFEIFTYYANNAIIPNEENLLEFDAIEDILMIGYPNGIWDDVNNLPIVRRGITATSPKVNYRGNSEFLIDAACFPGSSGSPIIFLDKRSKTEVGSQQIIGFRTYLLGVLYSGPQHRTSPNGIAIPNNLGVVIMASKILELEKLIVEYIKKPTR